MKNPVRPFKIESVGAPETLKGFVWPHLFLDSSRPLDLEIGCGVGWHPIRYAQENSGRNLIAVEHTREKFERFRTRVDRHPHLDNLLAIHADAIRWVSHALKAESLDRCFLLYPNPEPKAVNKRWMRSPFMHQLLKTLKSGGELILATNEAWYFEEAKDWAVDHWHLEMREQRAFAHNSSPEDVPRTHFERKYLLGGQTCFDVCFRKP